MSNKKRVAIRCHHCRRAFSHLREFDGRPAFRVPCPFCKRDNIIDLAPYRSQRRPIMAGEEAEPLTLDVLELPDELPGRAPRPDEEID